MTRRVRVAALVAPALAGAHAHAGWSFKDKLTEASLQRARVTQASLSPDGKCGVSLAGVSDLEKELRFDSDIRKSAVQRELARSRVGDPALMKAAFDAVSPLQHADGIKAPLLRVHGKLDERVPMSQGQQIYERMRALHKDVKWVEFSDEGHSLWHVENQRDDDDAVFERLERTIGKGVPPANAPGQP